MKHDLSPLALAVGAVGARKAHISKVRADAARQNVGQRGPQAATKAYLLHALYRVRGAASDADALAVLYEVYRAR